MHSTLIAIKSNNIWKPQHASLEHKPDNAPSNGDLEEALKFYEDHLATISQNNKKRSLPAIDEHLASLLPKALLQDKSMTMRSAKATHVDPRFGSYT